MKLSHPLAIRGSALVLSAWLRLWFSASSFHEEFGEPSLHPDHLRSSHIYLFWHENLLIPAYAYANPRVAVLISRHRDGELIAQILRMLGGASVRGSSTHGGAQALRTMLQVGRDRHLAITPDGPRGPRRVIQPGAVFVASSLGIPVVPVGIAVRRAWRTRSWDRMVIPHFASPVYVVAGQAVSIPSGTSRDALEHYRGVVQQAMDRAQRLAEERAGLTPEKTAVA